jgi:hypothetical protein
MTEIAGDIGKLLGNPSRTTDFGSSRRIASSPGLSPRAKINFAIEYFPRHFTPVHDK